MTISGRAKIAGVIGWPVAQSRSPLMHNHWISTLGLEAAYVPLAVKPENIERAVRALPALGFQGANVTVPHKEAALKACDGLDAAARRIGAVNTIVVREDGGLEGRNTDAVGFAESLRALGPRKTLFQRGRKPEGRAERRRARGLLAELLREHLQPRAHENRRDAKRNAAEILAEPSRSAAD